MKCRAGCGACCIAPSITTPIPGMPAGKPAGVRCIQLSEDNQCRLFNDPCRPQVCLDLMPHGDICGENYQQAMALIHHLEITTGPKS